MFISIHFTELTKQGEGSESELSLVEVFKNTRREERNEHTLNTKQQKTESQNDTRGEMSKRPEK